MKTNFSKEEIKEIKNIMEKVIQEYNLKKSDIIREAEENINVSVKEDVLSKANDIDRILSNITYDGNNVIIKNKKGEHLIGILLFSNQHIRIYWQTFQKQYIINFIIMSISCFILLSTLGSLLISSSIYSISFSKTR